MQRWAIDSEFLYRSRRPKVPFSKPSPIVCGSKSGQRQLVGRWMRFNYGDALRAPRAIGSRVAFGWAEIISTLTAGGYHPRPRRTKTPPRAPSSSGRSGKEVCYYVTLFSCESGRKPRERHRTFVKGVWVIRLLRAETRNQTRSRTGPLEQRLNILLISACLTMGASAPASAGWTAGLLELDEEVTWTPTSGSSKSVSVTSSSARMNGTSDSASSCNSPSSATLERVYQRVCTYSGSGDGLTVIITGDACVTVDTAMDTGRGGTEAPATASANAATRNSVFCTASAGQSAMGTSNPPLVAAEDLSVPSSYQQLTETTTATATVKANSWTKAERSGTSNPAAASASAPGWSRATFSAP